MTSVVLENALWLVPLQPPWRELENPWGGFPQKIRYNWRLGWWPNSSSAAICIHNLFPPPSAFWWGFKNSSTWYWVYVWNVHQTYIAIQKDCSEWRQVIFLKLDWGNSWIDNWTIILRHQAIFLAPAPRGRVSLVSCNCTCWMDCIFQYWARPSFPKNE